MLEQSLGIEVLPVRDGAGLGAGVGGVGGVGGGRAALMGDDGAGYRAKAKQSDGKGVSMGVNMDAVSNPSVDGLQRALEAEAVNHLPISEFAVDGRGRETEGYDVTVWKGIQRVMVRSWGVCQCGGDSA